jgi:hypothetical protein
VEQPQQQQLDVGTTFTTKRTRPAVVAVITTLLAYGLAPRPQSFGTYDLAHLPVLMIFSVLCLLCLLTAVRSWFLVIRRPVELRVTPTDLTVKRGGQELTVPWAAAGHIRVGGDFRWPWVVAYLDPTVGPDQVPASRGRDGAYKLFPVGHGQSAKQRGRKLRELRAAIMGSSRRYLDEIG